MIQYLLNFVINILPNFSELYWRLSIEKIIFGRWLL